MCSQINQVSREEWGARSPTSRSPISTPVSTMYVHHTVTAQCFTQSACEQSVRQIQDYHMDALGTSDTGLPHQNYGLQVDLLDSEIADLGV